MSAVSLGGKYINKNFINVLYQKSFLFSSDREVVPSVDLNHSTKEANILPSVNSSKVGVNLPTCSTLLIFFFFFTLFLLRELSS